MMDCYYCYYIVYDPPTPTSPLPQQQSTITQLSLHKLWQGEKQNVGLRRQVLVRNTLLTCLLVDHDQQEQRVQEETWLDACFHDLEQDDDDYNVDDDDDPQHTLFFNDNNNNDDDNNDTIENESNHYSLEHAYQKQQKDVQQQNQQSKPAMPNTAEFQRRQNMKNDATCWRWQL